MYLEEEKISEIMESLRIYDPWLNSTAYPLLIMAVGPVPAI